MKTIGVFVAIFSGFIVFDVFSVAFGLFVIPFNDFVIAFDDFEGSRTAADALIPVLRRCSIALLSFSVTTDNAARQHPMMDISSYNKNDARVFGFVSERLLDIWLETKGYAYKTMPYVFMESQNWVIKGWNFLKRKIGRK